MYNEGGDAGGVIHDLTSLYAGEGGVVQGLENSYGDGVGQVGLQFIQGEGAVGDFQGVRRPYPEVIGGGLPGDGSVYSGDDDSVGGGVPFHISHAAKNKIHDRVSRSITIDFTKRDPDPIEIRGGS